MKKLMGLLFLVSITAHTASASTLQCHGVIDGDSSNYVLADITKIEDSPIGLIEKAQIERVELVFPRYKDAKIFISARYTGATRVSSPSLSVGVEQVLGDSVAFASAATKSNGLDLSIKVFEDAFINMSCNRVD